MSEASMEQPGAAKDDSGQNQGGECDPSPALRDGIGEMEGDVNPKGMLLEIERFSRLTSDLKDCLLNMIHKTKDAMDALGTVERAVEEKKGELKQLHGIETAAVSLEKLIEEHRRQREEFDSFITEQRRHWAEEKALREKEDSEYRENLERCRQQEMQDYARELADEKSAMREKMEEEIHALQSRIHEKQREIEADIENRERVINKKEEDISRLVRELELFMAKLEARAMQTETSMPSGDDELLNRGAISRSWFDSGDIESQDAATDQKVLLEAIENIKGNKNLSDAAIRKILFGKDRGIGDTEPGLAENRDSLPPGENA